MGYRTHIYIADASVDVEAIVQGDHVCCALDAALGDKYTGLGKQYPFHGVCDNLFDRYDDFDLFVVSKEQLKVVIEQMHQEYVAYMKEKEQQVDSLIREATASGDYEPLAGFAHDLRCHLSFEKLEKFNLEADKDLTRGSWDSFHIILSLVDLYRRFDFDNKQLIVWCH
jgi:hypothetical protein